MAITYGMTAKEFWEDDPDLFWAYRFSYFEKIKAEQEIFNYNAWLQGAYFYDAIATALNNSFTSSKVDYPKVPYGTNAPKTNTNFVKEKQNTLVSNIKARAEQVQAIMGKNNSSTTTKRGDTKGGEKVNE